MVEIIVEFLKIIPSLLWFLLVAGILFAFYQPIKDELLPHLTGFKAMGVELSFLNESIDAAVKQAEQRDSRVELAEKAPQWKVSVSSRDKQRALKRVRSHLKILRGKRILWVDDHPENNLNEMRMFRQLGVEIDTTLSTDKALTALQKEEYDVILTDMSRGKEATAGLTFLKKYRKDGGNIPVIFYIGVMDPAKGRPPGAFGITNRPDELLHLFLDAVERKAY